MPYATVADVQQQAVNRPINASSRPSETQVVDWLNQTAGVLDGILREQGYVLPVPTSATEALTTLEHYNAIGAAAFVEHAAPSSDRRKEAMALWEHAQKMLKCGDIDIGAPKDDAVHSVRSSPAGTPMFSREMEL